MKNFLVNFAILSLLVWSCDSVSKKPGISPEKFVGVDKTGDAVGQNSEQTPLNQTTTGNEANSSDTLGGDGINTGNVDTSNQADGKVATSSEASGAGSGRDCRDDWSEFPWKKEAATECTKCWECKGEGFLPGMAFVACKLGNNQCYRFATANNCDYENFPRNKGLLPVRDPTKYCRKDHKNYTFFHCEVDGNKYIFQTVDATHYYNSADKQGDIVAGVASVLPIPGGCADKSN